MSVVGDVAAADRAETTDEAVLRLWGNKLDTEAISRCLRLPEYFVANRLAELRDAGRR
ncbi:hypothetical protein AAFG13_06700 [Bradyrhizobium sp. B124]|uniref:hypothetical protein n=1 Tax=Bradyrhizobium sp. B124 TaxID=3140245 RepID=UPI0031843BB9